MIPPRRSAVRWAVGSFAVCCGCAGSPPVQGALVTEVVAILIHESTEAPLGEFATLAARAADGRLFIGDMTGKMVHVFAPDGQPLLRIGKPGSGPGEFQAVGGIALADQDSLLLAADPNRAALIQFSSVTGEVVREGPFPGGALAPSGWVVSDAAAAIPVVGAPQPFLRWDRRTDSMAPFGETPGEWGGSPGLALQHGVPSLVITGTGWLAQLPLVPGLGVLEPDGRRTGLLPIPAPRRLGEDPEAAARAIELARQGGPRRIDPIASYAMGLHRRPDGDLMVVHLDPTLERTGSGVRASNLRYYLSLVRADLSAVCADAAVPVETEVFARPIFSGDTLWLLTRKTEHADAVATVLRGFLVDEGGCDWLPVTVGAAR